MAKEEEFQAEEQLVQRPCGGSIGKKERVHLTRRLSGVFLHGVVRP